MAKPADGLCRWSTNIERLRVPFLAYRSAPGLQRRSRIGQCEQRDRNDVHTSVREADLLGPVPVSKIPDEFSPRPQSTLTQHRTEMVLDGSRAEK
jgi:hypothetical protein